MELTVAFRSAVLSCILLNSISAQPARPAPYPPPGELVDVGGYRVHLYCAGQGSPTVMIVGAGFSFDWDLVQSAAATFTRVCTYDPAGTGWSDPGPGPDCSERVNQIHRLLQTAHVQGPFVFVGLSIGALVARLYASRYPDEVAGMMIADHPYLESAIGPTQARAPQSTFDTPPVLISQTPIVLDSDEDLSRLPLRDQQLHRWAVSLHPVLPSVDTARACLSQIDGAMLGRIPLVVVSTGNQNFAYMKLQERLLALSRLGRQVIAERSGHTIELDEPEAIVRAIAQLR